MQRVILLVVAWIAYLTLQAQNDTIIFKNGEYLVGKFKSMKRGVLNMTTENSSEDIRMKWNQVITLHTSRYFTVTLKDRTVLPDAVLMMKADTTMTISSGVIEKTIVLNEIDIIEENRPTFLDRLSASIDFGYSLTKSSNLQQFNTRSTLGYNTEWWNFTGAYNQVRSTRDGSDPIKRTDAYLSANYQFSKLIFIGSRVNFLSNTEQRLDLRATGQIVGGYYFIRKSGFYWNTSLGLAYNNEQFLQNAETLETPPRRTSMEAVAGTEFSIQSWGRTTLFTNFMWYPSLTETGRHRIDYRFDISYRLPRGFYLKTGLNLNYDNRPVEGATDTDYVLQTGFGWQL